MKGMIWVFLVVLLQGFTIKTTPAPNVCLTAEEMKLYNLIMEYRKSKGLKPIPLSSKLTQVAQVHARDLAANYHFDESNTCNLHSWSDQGSWTSCCYTNDHKQAKCMWNKPREINGYPGNGFEISHFKSSGANAQEGIDGWKLSPGHDTVLTNSGMWSSVTWKAIGIGIYGEYGLVWFGEVDDAESPGLCE